MLNFERKIVIQLIFFGLHLNAWIQILLPVGVGNRNNYQNIIYFNII